MTPQPLDPGGCTYSAVCNAANTCSPGPSYFKCCVYLGNCFTEGSGLMGRKDQTIDGKTPVDAITHTVRLPKVGLIVIGDSQHFKAGEIIVEVDSLPAHDEASWETWLKKGVGDCVYKVLEAHTHTVTTRMIARQ